MAFRIALSGFLAFVVAMGIGRFAFTPQVPLMIAEHQFSLTGAGLVAAFTATYCADDDVRMRVNRERFVAQIAAQIVEPRKFTSEEVVNLRRAVGEGEFDKLAKAALDARQGTSVNAPFSRDTFGTDLT